MERRRHQRISCILDATVETGEKQRFRPTRLARIVNISRGGVSMHTAEAFAAGMLLTMNLRSGDRQVGPVKVTIRHAAEWPDGTWILGAEFLEELSNEAVQAILAGGD